jgi:hypothetical protein
MDYASQSMCCNHTNYLIKSHHVTLDITLAVSNGPAQAQDHQVLIVILLFNL